MTQPGKRNRRCALLAASALGISASALAQTPAPAAPTPDTAAPATAPAPATAAEAAPAPAPAPAPEPPKPVYPAMAGPALKLTDLFTFRPGFQLQLWGTLTQDPFKQANGDNGAFAKNLYLRRSRFFFGGGIGKDLTYFLLLETFNLGLATPNADGSANKNFVPFAFNDAFIDYKINKYLSVQAGLTTVPFARNVLQSTATYWSIDIGGVSATNIAALQTQVLRDVGVELKINGNDNHFETRIMASQGGKVTDPTKSETGAGVPRTAGKNDPRITTYVQYNFLDGDSGYVFNGQYFGRKKIAGLAASFDYQAISDNNPYFATTAAAFAAIPLHGGDAKKGDDELGLIAQYEHFHGGGRTDANGALSPAAVLAKQDDYFVEAGYYNRDAKFSLFGKFEGRFFSDDSPAAARAGSFRQYAGGIKYFLAQQYFNLTLQYSITQFTDLPPTVAPLRNDVNAIQAQMQMFYF